MRSLIFQAGRRTTCLFAAVASFASWLFLSTRFRLFLAILQFLKCPISLFLMTLEIILLFLMQLEIISSFFTIFMPLEIVTIFLNFLFFSQLGWALLLARTLTGFADSLVMTKWWKQCIICFFSFCKLNCAKLMAKNRTVNWKQNNKKGDACWYPLHQRSSGNKVQVADQNWVKCIQT